MAFPNSYQKVEHDRALTRLWRDMDGASPGHREDRPEAGDDGEIGGEAEPAVMIVARQRCERVGVSASPRA